MLVVTLGGSPSQRSRSGVLLDHTRNWLQQQGVEVVSYQVRDFPAEDLLYARFDSPKVLDLLPERALAHKVVLPMATGGSIAHMLAVDYALKPVLSALKAQELLHGIFAEDSQIAYGEGNAQAQLVPILEQRLSEALEQFYSAMARRPQPLDPHVLNERLLSARWSI